jgi:hypothetical protein
LNTKFTEPLSDFAFKFNVRRYIKGGVKILDTTDGKESGGACQISLPSHRMPLNSKSSRKHALDDVAVNICLSLAAGAGALYVKGGSHIGGDVYMG